MSRIATLDAHHSRVGVCIKWSGPKNFHAFVWAVGEPAERNGSALHVREEAFESLSVVGLDLPLEVHGEAGMLPGPHALHGLGPHLLMAEHHPEEPLLEDRLEAGEVDVLQGEEDAVGAEESEGDAGVKVGCAR